MPNILALDISSTAIGWCWLQGDRAPLVAAWRAWGRECAACAELLLRADHMQRAVNTARLAEVRVL